MRFHVQSSLLATLVLFVGLAAAVPIGVDPDAVEVFSFIFLKSRFSLKPQVTKRQPDDEGHMFGTETHDFIDESVDEITEEVGM
jgi:hypothetical protein